MTGSAQHIFDAAYESADISMEARDKLDRLDEAFAQIAHVTPLQKVGSAWNVRGSVDHQNFAPQKVALGSNPVGCKSRHQASRQNGDDDLAEIHGVVLNPEYGTKPFRWRSAKRSSISAARPGSVGKSLGWRCRASLVHDSQ